MAYAGTYEFLSNGKQYTETQNIEGGTINIVITFNGSNLDMFCEYNTNTFYETETYIGVFSDDPIKWVIDNTDLASPLKACEGYLKFSTGNMSFNPYKSGNDILIQTVSGKSYTVRGNAIALSSEIDNVVNTLRIINDERIALYKNKKVDEWNEKSN
jgi:hypothetical protein